MTLTWDGSFHWLSISHVINFNNQMNGYIWTCNITNAMYHFWTTFPQNKYYQHLQMLLPNEYLKNFSKLIYTKPYQNHNLLVVGRNFLSHLFSGVCSMSSSGSFQKIFPAFHFPIPWYSPLMQEETHELSHDETNKMACAPSDESNQPGHPPRLIWVFAIHMNKVWVLSYPLRAQQRLWSDWADAQADLSLRWAQSHIVGFVMKWLKWLCRARSLKSLRALRVNCF